MASRRRPPPRVDSTQPRDTSPEPSSSGEETAGEYPPTAPSTQPTSRESSLTNGERGDVKATPLNGRELWKESGDDEGDGKGGDSDDDDWVDEDDEADDSDLLDFEYHPNYIPNTDKRRRRWEVGWEALVQAVRLSFSIHSRHWLLTPVCLTVPKIGPPNRHHNGRSRCSASLQQTLFNSLSFHPSVRCSS